MTLRFPDPPLLRVHGDATILARTTDRTFRVDVICRGTVVYSEQFQDLGEANRAFDRVKVAYPHALAKTAS